MARSNSPAPVADPVADLLAPFRVAPERKVTFEETTGATRANVPSVSDSAYVTRAKSTRNGVPVLLLVDGSQRTALPLSCIGAAVAGGTLTRDEISALLGITE